MTDQREDTGCPPHCCCGAPTCCDCGEPIPAAPLAFAERVPRGPGRSSIKKSHRAEGVNFID